MNTSYTEAIAAHARAQYGAELAPYSNDIQRITSWLSGWRDASTAEDKRKWVRSFVYPAVLAMTNNFLAPEEHLPILHEVLYLHDEGQIELSADDTAAYELTHARWDGCHQFAPGCICIWCTAQVCLATPPVTPKPVRAAVQAQPPAQPKRRGRPPGTKDVVKRATRGSLKDLTGSEKSARSRKGSSMRSTLLKQQQQQQQQQQQTPPT